MSSHWGFGAAAAIVATIATSTTGFAQAELKDNETANGRLAKAGQHDNWSFKLDEKAKKVTIQVSCDTTKVVVFLRRDGDDRLIVLRAEKGGRGQPNSAVGGGVHGHDVHASPDPDKYPALDKGRYVVVVRALDGRGTGDYTIKVPELKKPAGKPDAPKPPGSGR